MLSIKSPVAVALGTTLARQADLCHEKKKGHVRKVKKINVAHFQDNTVFFLAKILNHPFIPNFTLLLYFYLTIYFPNFYFIHLFAIEDHSSSSQKLLILNIFGQRTFKFYHDPS